MHMLSKQSKDIIITSYLSASLFTCYQCNTTGAGVGGEEDW